MKISTSRSKFRKASTGQNGAALIISLIFLLLMTLIGVTSMQTTTLEERMAGNTRDRTLALQAAEAGLRQGETWLGSLANRNTADNGVNLANPAAWDGGTPHGGATGYTPKLASDPVFYVGPGQQSGNGISDTGTFEFYYPVTSYAEGGVDSTIVILQTMFKPSN